MSDPNLEADLRRALHAKADALEVDDRAFDAEVGEVGDLAGPRRNRRAAWTALAAAAVIAVGVTVALLVGAPDSAPDRGVGEAPTVTETSPTTTASTTTTTVAIAGPSQPAPAALVEQVTSVPVSTGRVASDVAYPMGWRLLPGPRLAGAGDKARIVWVGAEYCPYCAAQRWPLVIALSRFGTFSDLRVTSSATRTPVGSPEVFPNTQSFSFHGSSYQSDSVEFEAAETNDNRYDALDELTPEQEALVAEYNAPPYVDAQSRGAIPFLDIANLSLFSGASYDTAILQGKTAQQIGDALVDPSNDVAKEVGRVANVITAAVCSALSHPERAPVCSDPTIAAMLSTISRNG